MGMEIHHPETADWEVLAVAALWMVIRKTYGIWLIQMLEFADSQQIP